MKEIRSKIDLYQDEYETIAMLSDTLIDKLEKNKLKKEDRELLIDAVALIFEIRKNEN